MATSESIHSAEEKAVREQQAFQRLLPNLLDQYRGQFVAIHDEAVVDHDNDDIELIQRVHRRIGYVPICVRLVKEEMPRERLAHYREYRGRASQ